MEKDKALDTSVLRVGLRVKNHRAMCELLGEPYNSSSNSKRSKEKRWSRFFKWSREGNAYIIEKIYPVPAPMPFSTQDIFSENVLCALLHYLCAGHTDRDGLSQSKLFEICGFTNKEWRKKDISRHLERFNIGRGEAKYQHHRLDLAIRNYCGYHLKESLKRIAQRGYISYHTELRVLTRGDVRPTTDKESTLYEKTLEDYKTRTGHVYITGYDKQFMDDLRRALNIPDLERIYDVYHINVNKEVPLIQLDSELLNDPKRSQLLINERVVAHMLKVVEREYYRTGWNHLISKVGEDDAIAYGGTVAMRKGIKDELRALVNEYVAI